MHVNIKYILLLCIIPFELCALLYYYTVCMLGSVLMMSDCTSGLGTNTSQQVKRVNRCQRGWRTRCKSRLFEFFFSSSSWRVILSLSQPRPALNARPVGRGGVDYYNPVLLQHKGTSDYNKIFCLRSLYTKYKGSGRVGAFRDNPETTSPFPEPAGRGCCGFVVCWRRSSRKASTLYDTC